MKKILFLLCVLYCAPSYANDFYYKDMHKHVSVDIGNNIQLNAKRELLQTEVNMFRRIINETKKNFYKFKKIGQQQCDNGSLNIYVVPQTDLDSRVYFPDEYEYSDEIDIIVGRYFRNSNTLYIAEKRDIKNWHKALTHEVSHYLYDDCGIVFDNDGQEHAQIQQFLNKYWLFY